MYYIWESVEPQPDKCNLVKKKEKSAVVTSEIQSWSLRSHEMEIKKIASQLHSGVNALIINIISSAHVVTSPLKPNGSVRSFLSHSVARRNVNKVPHQ